MAQNVIIMVGDGMGWEMTRAGAVQTIIEQEITNYRTENPGATNQEIYEALFANDTLQDAEYYTEGQGFGTSYQDLDGFAISTTGNTYIDGSKSNSALEGTPFNHNTGQSEVRDGFVFNPEAADVVGFGSGEFDESPTGEGGNVPIFDLEAGGTSPWDTNYYENRGNPTEGFDPAYIQNLYPDSAGTATSLYTGVKTYVGSISVDIFEEAVETTAEAALDSGKSVGVVSSVPYNHATPAAAVAHVNNRNKTTELSFDDRAGNENGNPTDDLDEFGHEIEDSDNIFYQIVNETKPTVVLGGGHPDGRGDERYLTQAELQNLRDGVYDYTFLERAPGAAETLASTAAELDPDNGDRLFGVYGARGQGGNLPWRTANDDYSRVGIGYDRGDGTFSDRPLEEGETDEAFIAREVDENPTLANLTEAALDVLGDDDQGFWVSIEGGDIDWAAHANDMDAMLGTLKDFDESVEVVQDWIAENGGYEENLLIVTADHDHYLTLNDAFPQLLAQELLLGDGGNGLTALQSVVEAGHFWGPDETVKNGWGTHTSRPVPVYYQGPSQDEAFLEGFVGQGYEAYGTEVEGVGTYVDQVHLGIAQLAALEDTPELVSGTTGDDELFAIPDSEFDGTNDILFTGSGADEVDVSIGGNGRNRINTGSGDDLIFVGNRDRVSGSSGNDEFDATDAERYRLSGGDGDDIFFLGTKGRALGGEGNDSFFVQEEGDNLLSGGQGTDAFWIVNGDLPASSNTILDFEIGTDVIGISGQSCLTFDELGLSGNEISINSNVVAVIQGIDTTTLDANSFAFA